MHSENVNGLRVLKKDWMDMLHMAADELAESDLEQGHQVSTLSTKVQHHLDGECCLISLSSFFKCKPPNKLFLINNN